MNTSEHTETISLEAALAQKDDLQLSYGVALSAAQIEKLTSDLVWMVEVTLDNGQKALKPVVYFSAATRMAIDSSGPLIVAQNGDLNLFAGGDITSSDRLSGADTTLASTGGSVTNTGGLLTDKNVSLSATIETQRGMDHNSNKMQPVKTGLWHQGTAFFLA